MKYYVSVIIILHSLSLFGQPKSFQSYGIGGGGAMFFPKINPTNDNEFYISCDMSELFHSTDFGNSYSQIPFTQFQATNVSTYEFTNNPNIAYSNFNDGNEGFPVKTLNGGQSWIQLAGFDSNLGGIYRMFANFNNPNQLIMNYYGDIVISNDGGATFSLVKHCANNGAGIIASGVFYDGNNITIATNEGLFKSIDSGITFTAFTTTGIPTGEVIWHFSAAKSGNTTRFICITASIADVYNGLMPYDYYGLAKGVYVMDNLNGNWVAKSAGINFNSDYIMYSGMAQNDVNTIYLAGSDEALNAPLIFKSIDGGNSWNKVFKSTNNQNVITGWSGYQGDKNWSWGETAFGIAVAPNNSNKLIFGDFGFVHVSSDGGNSWKQAYVDVKDQHPANIVTPTKKTYHSIGLENTSSWQIHWIDAQNLFACYSDIGAIRSRDGGKSWGFDYNGFSVNSLYRIVQLNNGNIYGACSNIHDMYQSTRLADAKLDANDANGKIVFSIDKGENWTTLHTFNHPVFWLASDPKDNNILYASVIHYSGGTGQGGIWVTKDLNKGASSTWTKLPNPPRTEGHPATIEILKNGKVLCTFSGRRNSNGTFTKSSGVFVYDPSSGNWSDVSHSGMYYWTKDIVIDPSDTTQNTWYVGVFSGWGGAPNGLGGLYRTKDSGLSWTKLTGSQFDRVTSLTFNPQNNNQAYMTTETNGLWVSNDIHSINPTFSLVDSYIFRQPERVYFNPFNKDEMWVSSFGNGMKMGKMNSSDLPEIIEISTFDILPNPFDSKLSLRFNNIFLDDYLEIYNIKGEQVFKSKITNNYYEINTINWATGVYFVKYQQQTIKIVKQSQP
ncbi:MAG: T9SS type A sorting domain-containing protein [Saprospiraceae bacterium]|nr:T9SS type A sorting domain-containing protein [Saprospiraceae bacterium]